ncbi:MAG: transposase [Phycisphaeraceae bacterium]
MAMGKRNQQEQQALWVSTQDLALPASHPYYRTVNELLAAHGFDDWVQEVCQPFYHQVLGRPSLAPGIYFRGLLIGYFEGIDSERGIAWRVADSLSLRQFLGIPLDKATPDHSTLSRTRRLIDLETHGRVFTWILKVLAVQGLVQGKTLGLDATTLEANAALRSIVRNDHVPGAGQGYQEFLADLAKASGIETPTREELARLDKTRKNKASNDDWHNPHDPEARITKMKDGRTHLAHKVEHAVDMTPIPECPAGSGAILAVTIQPADSGDTTSWRPTVEETCANHHALLNDPLTAEQVHDEPVEELVADKGYHSNQTMADYQEIGTRSYVSEPERGRRKWEGKAQEQRAVYANRRRVRGRRGKVLLRRRGELLERSFAHCYDTGGMRRTHLRGHANILKRLLVHAGGFNLSLVLRRVLGVGTARGMQDRGAAPRSGVGAALGRLAAALRLSRTPIETMRGPQTPGRAWATLWTSFESLSAAA